MFSQSFDFVILHQVHSTNNAVYEDLSALSRTKVRSVEFEEIFHLSFVTFSNHRRCWHLWLFLLERLQRSSILEAVIKYDVLVPQIACLMDVDANQSYLQAGTHPWLCRGFGVDWRKLISVPRHELSDIC